MKKNLFKDFAPKHESFQFSASIDEEIFRFFKIIKPLELLLNTHLDLAKYGDEVKIIGFFFLANNPTFPIFKEGAFYTKKNQELFLQKALDFEQLLTANEEQAKQIMANLFLASILTYPKIRGMKKVKFDVQTFYDDVQALIKNAEWTT